MIPVELKTLCATQIREWGVKINPVPLVPDQIVWHYTRGDSFIKMVESGQMYFTQISSLNDSSELRYAANLLRTAMVDLLPELGEKAKAQKFITRYIELLTDNVELPGHAASPFFVACFSELEDDLGQWRSYAGGESGYAIGIQIQHLFGVNRSLVGQVNYDAEFHRELSTEVAIRTVSLYEEWSVDVSDENLLEWENEFIEFWNEQVSGLAPFVKNPGFSLEKEIRVAHAYSHDELNELIFMQRRTMMSRHLALSFPIAAKKDKAYLPISKVLIGPGRHKHISLVGANTLLKKRGYPDGTAKVSSRPYQET